LRAISHAACGEQGSDPAGVRRTARVLEQQGIEQRRARGVVQIEPRRETHPDHAAALGMTTDLTLGYIEGIGKAGEHLGQPQFDAAVARRRGVLVLHTIRIAHHRIGREKLHVWFARCTSEDKSR